MYRFSAYCAATWLFVASATAGLVDFENASLHGGDDAVITDSYLAAYGMSITTLVGKKASSATEVQLSFEAVGREETDAFWTNSSGRDIALSDSLGSFFMKVGTEGREYKSSKYLKMSINFDETTTAASGQVWDIDGPQQYQVTAFDANDAAVASLESPIGGLDAAPWNWSVEVDGGVSISKVEIESIGNGTLGDFAFDNLNFGQADAGTTGHNAPLPAAFPVGIVGLMAAAAMRRRFTA